MQQLSLRKSVRLNILSALRRKAEGEKGKIFLPGSYSDIRAGPDRAEGRLPFAGSSGRICNWEAGEGTGRITQESKISMYQDCSSGWRNVVLSTLRWKEYRQLLQGMRLWIKLKDEVLISGESWHKIMIPLIHFSGTRHLSQISRYKYVCLTRTLRNEYRRKCTCPLKNLPL